MRTLLMLYGLFLLILLNFTIVPLLISADDTLLTILGFLVIITEVGLVINYVKNRNKKEESNA